MRAATWMVHSTVDEPPELLCALAAHYLARGAAEVHLCLDRPTEEAVAALRPLAGVRLTRCDARWWRDAPGGVRPANSARRQILNARRAFEGLRADWMFFCDADEYLHAEMPVGAALAALPADAPLVRVGMAERVFVAGAPAADIFAGAFRLPLARFDDPPPNPAPLPWGLARVRRGLARRVAALAGRLRPSEAERRRARLAQVYGDNARFLNGAGLLGHAAGKSFTRRGAPVSPGVHYPRPAGSRPGDLGFLHRPEWRRGLPAAHLLHFDGLTPLHWLLKHVRAYAGFAAAEGRADPRLGRQSEARKAQSRAVHAARHDPAALAALVEGCIRLSPAQIAVLEAAGLARNFPADIAATAARAFPGRRLDFTPATFDARLRALHAELIAATGFAA